VSLFKNFNTKKDQCLFLSEFEVLVSLMIRSSEKMMKMNGSSQINMGALNLTKRSVSKYFPKNNNKKIATAHCDAKPANFDQTILLSAEGLFFNL
jgi:hypothetical protein